MADCERLDAPSSSLQAGLDASVVVFGRVGDTESGPESVVMAGMCRGKLRQRGSFQSLAGTTSQRTQWQVRQITRLLPQRSAAPIYSAKLVSFPILPTFFIVVHDIQLPLHNNDPHRTRYFASCHPQGPLRVQDRHRQAHPEGRRRHSQLGFPQG